jgi:hypothetical protein
VNEVLTEIAKQAMVEHCISHVRLQEFAELIVKECASLVVGDPAFILEHFGVKE